MTEIFGYLVSHYKIFGYSLTKEIFVDHRGLEFSNHLSDLVGSRLPYEYEKTKLASLSRRKPSQFPVAQYQVYTQSRIHNKTHYEY